MIVDVDPIEFLGSVNNITSISSSFKSKTTSTHFLISNFLNLLKISYHHPTDLLQFWIQKQLSQ